MIDFLDVRDEIRDNRHESLIDTKVFANTGLVISDAGLVEIDQITEIAFLV